MKKLTLALTISLIAMTACISYAGGERAYEVPGTSYLILPDVVPTTAAAFAITNAYSRGDYVEDLQPNGSHYFWCITAGTSSNAAPTWVYDGTDVTSSNAVFRYIIPTRQRFQCQNLGSANTSFAFGQAAVVNVGRVAVGNAGGSVLSGYDGLECYQGEVYAIANSGTNTIAVSEER